MDQGDKEDIRRRKQLSRIAINNLNKLRKKKKHTTLEKILKLYNSLVKSILLYNSSTWGLTKQDEKKLNSFHRQQLRKVLGIFWSHKISNKKLYQRTNTKPISIEITERRWKSFGHILRRDKDTPGRKAMQLFFEIRSNRKFSGRKRATIHSTRNRDIKETTIRDKTFNISDLKSEIDLV